VDDWQRMLTDAVAAHIGARLAAAQAGMTDEEWSQLWQERYAEMVDLMREQASSVS
jgi:hypothetical protein